MELSSEDESDFAKPEKLKADLQKKVNNFWGEWKFSVVCHMYTWKKNCVLQTQFNDPVSASLP